MIRTTKNKIRLKSWSPTGRLDAALSRRGFTLIEILLVAFIMAMLAGSMVPRLKNSYDNVKLAGALNEIAGTIELVSSHAILHRSEERLLFDSRAGRFWLDRSNRPPTEEDSLLRKGHVLPKGMTLQLITEGLESSNEQKSEIYFYPDGRRTPVLIELMDSRKSKRRLRVGTTLGIYEIERINPEI